MLKCCLHVVLWCPVLRTCPGFGKGRVLVYPWFVVPPVVRKNSFVTGNIFRGLRSAMGQNKGGAHEL